MFLNVILIAFSLKACIWLLGFLMQVLHLFQNSMHCYSNQVIFSRHVEVHNEGAIDFYKKFGFDIVETKEQYCQRIEPADAHVLRKTLRRPSSNGLPPESKS